jgi:hypothetical protein
MFNISSSNISRSQALKAGDLHGIVMKDLMKILQESNSNLTKANEIAFDGLTTHNLITENEKEIVLPYIIDLKQKIADKGLETVKKEISALVKDLYTKSCVSIITITNIMNNSLSNVNSTDIVKVMGNWPYGIQSTYALPPSDPLSTFYMDVFCGSVGAVGVGRGLDPIVAGASSSVAATGHIF